jgi:hypothetical protein
MATRSTIAIENEDGTVNSVYCHWDGYISHNGKILLEHYSDRAKLAELIKHGSISSLGPEIGIKHDFNDHSHDMTTFYGRDRDEKDCGFRRFICLAEYLLSENQEYNYFLRTDNVWYVSTEKLRGFSVLSERLEMGKDE